MIMNTKPHQPEAQAEGCPASPAAFAPPHRSAPPRPLGLRLALVWVMCVAALVAVSGGCTGSVESDVRFRINLEGFNPAEVSTEQRQHLVNATVAFFGTPDEPYVFDGTGLDAKKLQMAAGPSWSDEEGVHRGLYRKHCAHCHGISGDGAGPTAIFLNPYPRDYRPGIFKFKSTQRASKPTTADMRRILHHGIPGTAMPSFALLHEDEIDALIEYVKYLSIRGQTEQMLVSRLVEADEELTRDVIVEELTLVVDTWNEAESSIITPPERPPVDTPAQLAASIDAGHKLFLAKEKSQCVNCHGPTGLGDGGDDKVYDDWNKIKLDKPAADFALPIQRLLPRNLRLGIYRGGRRPLDIYRRIHAGINGTQMPEFGPSPSNPKGALKAEEIWNLVDYVLSLPYEKSSRVHEPASVAQRARF